MIASGYGMGGGTDHFEMGRGVTVNLCHFYFLMNFQMQFFYIVGFQMDPIYMYSQLLIVLHKQIWK